MNSFKNRSNFNAAGSLLIVVFILLIIFVIAVGLFYLSKNNKTRFNSGIDFWIHGEPVQSFGVEDSFFVFIKNKEIRELEDITVTLFFPDKFNLIHENLECEEISTNRCSWHIDRIAKNGLKDIKFSGIFLGDINSPQVFRGEINFKLKGFSSVFQKKLSFSVNIEPSFMLSVNMPDKALSYEDLEFDFFLKSIVNENISNIKIIFNFPDNFIPKKIININNKEEKVNTTEQSNNIDINIDKIDKKELNFKIIGFFDKPNKDSFFNINAGIIDNKVFYNQSLQPENINVTDFGFKALVSIDENKEPVQDYDWGDDVSIKMAYFNDSDKVVEDFVLEMRIDNKKYAYISEDDLLFKIKKVLPGESGNVNFSLPLKSSTQASKNNYKNANFLIYAMASGIFSDNQEWKSKSNEIDIRINTFVELEAEARYYNDERVAIGSGNLPPKMGEETSYWIFWRIKNTTNSIKDIFVKTKLPTNVSYLNKTGATNGLILYDAKARQVIWQIPTISAYRGGGYSLLEAGFEVSVSPIISNVGSVMDLTKDIFLNFEDNFTQDSTSIIKNPLNTFLNADPVFNGSGVVLK
ncbi:hypothetical protein ISS06_01470 [Patescibacteria group bacterium]|nr:hypothetical protein [Patescibacteria group bacterium]